MRKTLQQKVLEMHLSPDEVGFVFDKDVEKLNLAAAKKRFLKEVKRVIQDPATQQTFDAKLMQLCRFSNDLLNAHIEFSKLKGTKVKERVISIPWEADLRSFCIRVTGALNTTRYTVNNRDAKEDLGEAVSFEQWQILASKKISKIK
jgi:hypothetical protein